MKNRTYVLLILAAFCAGCFFIAQYSRRAISSPQVIPISVPFYGVARSSDQRRLYIGDLHVFDVFQNSITASAEYYDPIHISRYSGHLWASNADCSVVYKLEGLQLQPIQQFTIVPPAYDGQFRWWLIDWGEQFLYTYVQDRFEAMKYRLLDGQYTGVSTRGLLGPVLLADNQFIYNQSRSHASNEEYHEWSEGLGAEYRTGSILIRHSAVTLEKIPDSRFAANSTCEGVFSEAPLYFTSPDGARVYAVDQYGRWVESYGPEHSEFYKYAGIICIDAQTEQVIWLLNRDDGFEGLNGNIDFDLSGRLMVAVGARGSGEAHFINTLTKQFVTLQVGTEDDSDVAVCTPKRTVYFSLPSQQALLEYPIPPGFLP